MKLFTKHMTSFASFLKGAADEYLAPGTGKRIFAIDAFKGSSVNWRYFRDVLFDRKDSNARYVELYNENNMSKRRPIVFMQKDIDATYGLHKSFAVRYKTRMQIYRDDFASKAYRIPSSINSTLGTVDAANERIQGES